METIKTLSRMNLSVVNEKLRQLRFWDECAYDLLLNAEEFVFLM